MASLPFSGALYVVCSLEMLDVRDTMGNCWKWSIIPAAWFAPPQGYNNVIYSNQFSPPREELIRKLQLSVPPASYESASSSSRGPACCLHPSHPPPRKKTYTHIHTMQEKLNLDPWHLAPDLSVWWPIDYVWPRLGNCCLVITSRVVVGSTISHSSPQDAGLQCAFDGHALFYGQSQTLHYK